MAEPVLIAAVVDDVLRKVCPSCDGSGWVSIVAGGHGYAGGPCRCVGGPNWRTPAPPVVWDDAPGDWGPVG